MVKYAASFNILDMLDLSMAEVYILQHLLKYSDRTLRFKLLEDINISLHEANEGKDYFTPTKFYYALGRLEERGYIVSIEGQKKRSAPVEVTPKIQELFSFIVQNLSSAKIDGYGSMMSLVKAFLDNFGLKRMDDTLVILPSYEHMIDPHKLQAISEFTDRLYVLTDDEQFQHYQERNPNNNLIQTSMVGPNIREANEYYDAVIFMDAPTRLTDEKLRGELIRVVKRPGILVIAGLQPISTIDHFIADPILNDLKVMPLPQITTEETLLDLIKSKELQETGVFLHNGFSLGWAWKK